MSRDHNPPRKGLRVILAEFPDGRVLARYANGTYWVIAPLGTMIPAEKVTMAQAVDRVLEAQAQVGERVLGAGAFFTLYDTERNRRAVS